MMVEKPVSVGIDIGGGSTKIGLVEPDGNIIVNEILKLKEVDAPEDLLDAYISKIKSWKNQYSNFQIQAIGVGVPGHVIHNHRATDICNLPFLNRFPLADYLEENLHLPVWIENDATYAGVGEYRYGSGQQSERFLLATLGTGIGLTFIEHGRILATGNGTLGDIGHMIIDRNLTFQCRKGCWGCIESVASGVAISRDAKQLAQKYPESFLGKVFERENRDPTVRHIIEGSFEDDPVCIGKLNETADWLGLWACNVVQIFAPHRFAFGGGWSAAGQGFIDKLYQRAKSVGIEEYYNRVTFVQATKGNLAGILGAASFAFDHARNTRI
ncbi:MAG: ROK family protein [Paracoccaceae bacterium]|nr:ROK family protein [Paracoccaceae bacterium]MDE2916126.1 ROK family protein [Paracoccaceae bacterium]